ncbi:DNA-binding response regulator [Alicyclobacillus dauci]|uniref:DNA-binding response regulator n=1 Tax=Alicyclobacillus dauci TaxID=1475485 RepID=A0ABY6Z5P0_9BACL|nr:DNA-binding response regulator [Alicyclobacillus dauci]WAH37942.1 DNA-binding response regulator [Alicyclobacillus dauci]
MATGNRERLMIVGFDQGYEAFLNMHRKLRTGARLERLHSGLGHAEQAFLKNVWWAMFHHFENLHPEYEIRDYDDGYRYLDFAYVQPYFRVCFEIDGLGPHWKNITKWKFSEHHQRQNALVIDGWYILRFTYDDVQEYPKLCQKTIQQLLGRWQMQSIALASLSVPEREIVRLATSAKHQITPHDVCKFLNVGSKHARHLLHVLVDKRWLEPASGNVRITSYQLHPSKVNTKW